MGTLPNGEGLRDFYCYLDDVLSRFHSSDEDAKPVVLGDGSTCYYVDKFNFVEFGLTLQEAADVRFLYLLDHPLYYWIFSGYVYDSSNLYICVEADFVTGEFRTMYNEMIYREIAIMAEGVSREHSPYNITLAYYERLLHKADYAYEDDGVTPRDDAWAHSIVGVFDPTYGEVVCEGVAEAFCLLLNYHGVENILVPGISGGMGHIWNLIRMDNGGWYWYDITWDDETYSPLGTDYKFFCVTDTQNVRYYLDRDGMSMDFPGFSYESLTFEQDHIIYWDLHVSLDMSGAVPDRAKNPFEGVVPTLRQTFTVDGMTYARTGYRTVQLTDVGGSTDIVIPETVTYHGVTYTVTSIGWVNKDGVYMTGSILSWIKAYTVYVPKTVSYVWDGALSGLRVTVTVDPENPWYTS